MKNNSPQKHAVISCLILVTGILLVVIGAMTTKEYKINLCLLIGAIVVIGGIVYHLIMMKCPYCAARLLVIDQSLKSAQSVIKSLKNKFQSAGQPNTVLGKKR